MHILQPWNFDLTICWNQIKLNQIAPSISQCRPIGNLSIYLISEARPLIAVAFVLSFIYHLFIYLVIYLSFLYLSCHLFIIYLFILSFIYHLFIYLVCRSLEPATPNTGKSFRNLIKSNRNQIVFTIFRLIWNTKRTCPFVLQFNRKMVNTIWFRFDLIRFRKDFSVCVLENCLVQSSERLVVLGNQVFPIEDTLETPRTSQHYRMEGFQGATGQPM